MTDVRSARRELLALEERLLCRLPGHPIAEPHADVYDQARASYDRETSAFDADRIRARIVQVRHALKRLDARQWGVCEGCGEDILPARLTAIPEATTCAPCQTHVERHARIITRSVEEPGEEASC